MGIDINAEIMAPFRALLSFFPDQIACAYVWVESTPKITEIQEPTSFDTPLANGKMYMLSTSFVEDNSFMRFKSVFNNVLWIDSMMPGSPLERNRTMMPAANDDRQRRMIFTTPPIPALHTPPKTTNRVIIIEERIAATHILIGNSVIIKAEAESNCAIMLTKTPMEQRIEPAISAFLPYSFETISSNVEHPLRLRGAI